MSKLHIGSFDTAVEISWHDKAKWRRSYRKWESKCKNKYREQLARDENRYSCYYITTWYRVKDEQLPQRREYTTGRGKPHYVYQEFEKSYTNQRGKLETIQIKGLFADRLAYKTIFSNQYKYKTVHVPVSKQYVRRGSRNGRHGKQMHTWSYYYTKRMNKRIRRMCDVPAKGGGYKKIV